MPSLKGVLFSHKLVMVVSIVLLAMTLLFLNLPSVQAAFPRYNEMFLDYYSDDSYTELVGTIHYDCQGGSYFTGEQTRYRITRINACP